MSEIGGSDTSWHHWSQPDTQKEWLPSDSHAQWVLDFLALLHRYSTRPDDKPAQRGTVYALHILGHLNRTDLIDDDRLVTALIWATARSTQTRCDEGSCVAESLKVTGVPLLGVVTVALLEYLVGALPEGSPRLVPIARKLQHVCSVVLSPKELPLGGFFREHRPRDGIAWWRAIKPIEYRILERDSRFLSLVYHLSSVDRENWLNDMQNDAYVRSWVCVIGRWWMAWDKFRSHALSRVSGSHITSLLACHRIRRPTREIWGPELQWVVALRVIAIDLLWSNTWQDSFQNLGPLAADTLDFLSELDPQQALLGVDLEEYLRKMQGCVKEVLCSVPRDAPYDTSSSLLFALKAELQKQIDIAAKFKVDHGSEPSQSLSPIHTFQCFAAA
ncbi:hypothetical protein EIP91_005415 [Steccherinum ochraceum]|uniref:Uncharacterized protein n=1 Tax=Steccherinum ochraceum TaxID=92696 RepID=A0A4R0R9N4_9APHY|nr:hypothetical protein EIP91_005415 [Steccherinum ochraceum]